MISKWSLTGLIAGFIFAVGSFIRYDILYPDTSEMVIGVSIGVLTMAVSFLYWRQLYLSHKLEAVEEFLADKFQEVK